ncbi:MAG: hypothetical protein KY475_06720 [Planctomycetes bacterium]|nr:hypothetical protein [Planctomycetota bacterium]
MKEELEDLEMALDAALEILCRMSPTDEQQRRQATLQWLILEMRSEIEATRSS